jgi:hypothetical protein
MKVLKHHRELMLFAQSVSGALHRRALRSVSLSELLVQGSLFVERHVRFQVCPHAFFDVFLEGFATSVRP